MELKRIPLQALKVDKQFQLSFPARPEERWQVVEKFHHLPMVVTNHQNTIIAGSDFYDYHKSKGSGRVAVISMKISARDGLFLNFNLLDTLFGTNLYEKLVFLDRILPVAEHQEIQRRVRLNFPLNQDLTAKLSALVAPRWRHLLVHDKADIKTALRICDFKPRDRHPLIRLFSDIHFSRGHSLQLLNMVEEVCFRDKIGVSQLFNRLGLKKSMQKPAPAHTIIAAIFEQRHPLLSEGERKWREEIKRLRLPSSFNVSHFPFFEKKRVELRASFESFQALKDFLDRIDMDANAQMAPKTDE